MRKIITAACLFCVIGFPVGFILLNKPIIKPQNEILNYYKKVADSMNYYYDKRHCYFRCDKQDSAYEAEKKYWYYRDSVVYYGNILFDSTAPYTEEKIICECD